MLWAPACVDAISELQCVALWWSLPALAILVDVWVKAAAPDQVSCNEMTTSSCTRSYFSYQKSANFLQGVPNILGFLARGAKYPRVFGRGFQISYCHAWGFRRFPRKCCMGMPDFLGLGYQIFCDTNLQTGRAGFVIHQEKGWLGVGTDAWVSCSARLANIPITKAIIHIYCLWGQTSAAVGWQASAQACTYC